MQVPLLDLQAQLAGLREEIIQAVTEVIDSTSYILGPKVEQLEENIASYSDAKYGIGVASGTDALLVSLMALGIGPGDLVMTTPFTFFATVGSIVRLGAEPLFVDIDPLTYNIDPDQAEEVLDRDAGTTKRIKAILPVHLFGQCAEMERILALANRFNIPVIEDAAQAIGSACPFRADGQRVWKKAGSMGVAGCFSFFPSKNLGGIGDGGMVVTSDERLAEQLKILRVHGGEPKYHHGVVGGNFRLDPIQAAVLSVKLSYLPSWHEARRQNAALYNRLFEESGLINSGRVELPAAVYEEQAQEEDLVPDYHIYNQYVIRAQDQDNLIKYLHSVNIGSEIYYPIPLHKQKCMAAAGFNELTFPESEKASQEVLALPIYPELTNEMQHYVVEKISSFFKR